ncbi:hypothetical protein LCGC14_1284280 [marine sediment metagenome]|uniref:Uncharacterized protein n=1 Tax=marine sediment metagenome TaxID=412755 RepID=A0A0F9KUB8_9ZZZZ
MAKKGYITQAYIIKCAVVACEVTNRTETEKVLKAEKRFGKLGWRYVPNRGWVCRRH